jgi:hypothetical protein
MHFRQEIFVANMKHFSIDEETLAQRQIQQA